MRTRQAPTSIRSPGPSTARSAVGARCEVRYRVNQGKWKAWKKNTADLGANFGENDKPVNFSQAKVYKVRVQTKLAADRDRQSDFSPPVFCPEN